jgi:hypothetical protein
VAAILCVGGPIKYKIKPNLHVTDAFLKDVVFPGIFKHFENDANNKIGRVLALPLLWAASHVQYSKDAHKRGLQCNPWR